MGRGSEAIGFLALDGIARLVRDSALREDSPREDSWKRIDRKANVPRMKAKPRLPASNWPGDRSRESISWAKMKRSCGVGRSTICLAFKDRLIWYSLYHAMWCLPTFSLNLCGFAARIFIALFEGFDPVVWIGLDRRFFLEAFGRGARYGDLPGKFCAAFKLSSISPSRLL